MTNDQPIFQDTRQALHVSYLIHSLPSTQKSPTQAVIERLVKENHVWDGLPAPKASGINFAGLTPMEVRGQCAQVVSMVNNLGHAGEAAAVNAMYGQGAYSEFYKGETRKESNFEQYTREKTGDAQAKLKALGVRYLAAYIEPILSGVEGKSIGGAGAMRVSVALALGWHIFGSKVQREGLSLSAIADKSGCTVQAVKYAKDRFRKQAEALYQRAYSVLDQRFVAGGLVLSER
jgi:hypothetical protein